MKQIIAFVKENKKIAALIVFWFVWLFAFVDAFAGSYEGFLLFIGGLLFVMCVFVHINEQEDKDNNEDDGGIVL